jgi:hypothetical protein
VLVLAAAAGLGALAAAALAADGQAPTAPAQPSSPLDYKSYLDEKMPVEAPKDSDAGAAANPDKAAIAGLRQSVVTIDGRPYYKFQSGRGAIIVPKVDHLSRAELERAVCNEDLKAVCDPTKGGPEDPERAKLCQAEGLREAMLAHAEYELSDGVALYAGSIMQTIQRSCGGDGKVPNAKALQAAFEIGVERRSKDPRHPGSEKVYVRPLPLKPEVGVGVSF